jgi:MerR family mercuric resistance operon transcriptional regulator
MLALLQAVQEFRRAAAGHKMMARPLTIGGLAKAAGVSVETVRYYQRRGLLREPLRPAGGQRRYPDSAVEDLHFIRRAQQLGFTLAEIKELLAHADDAPRVQEIAAARHARLSLQARQLAGMSAKLKALLDRSRRRKGAAGDPIIAALRGGKGAD